MRIGAYLGVHLVRADTGFHVQHRGHFPPSALDNRDLRGRQFFDAAGAGPVD